MSLDLAMFNELENAVPAGRQGEGGPSLRIYSWERPTISFGYSQTPGDLVDLPLCEKLGIDVVKRPTGGGMLFHTTSEITYCVVLPVTEGLGARDLGLGILEKSADAVIFALGRFGVSAEKSGVRDRGDTTFCFSYGSKHEILACEKKLVGSAQKRGRNCILQHGSIFVDDSYDEFLGVLRRPVALEEIAQSTTSMRELTGRVPHFAELSGALVEGFKEAFKVSFSLISPVAS
jgi:lipoate-protein ligase A